MTEPIVTEFSVTCDPSHAFDTWTAGIDRWWPANHTVSGEPAATIVLEPGVGGRIFERHPNGTEHHWGRVRQWDPPHGFAYSWHLGADADEATEVAVTFTRTTDGTMVRIEHDGWSRLGPSAGRRRDANRTGWGDLLPHLIAACEK